jgi:hypothetical protein
MNRIFATLVCVCFCSEFLSQRDTIVQQKHDSLDHTFYFPVFNLSGDETDADDHQESSGLLQSSRDVFLQFAAFQWGAARYKVRGYSGDQQTIMVNGVIMNDPSSGFGSWSNWGGLNDVTRNTEVRFGNVANRYGFSGPGGYVNIDSKASSFKRGSRFNYTLANRFFRNRIMMTHSTGMKRSGWAFSLSVSVRFGENLYVPGTYFNAGSFYMSVDKRLNYKNTLSFTGFFAPVSKARSASATLEAYHLAGNNYYNSLWGYQNGKIRNAAVNTIQRPVLMFSHIFQKNTQNKFITSLVYTFGKSGQTALNWNNAVNPRPDYYRYLPNYHYDKGDQINGDRFTELWLNNENTRQINWDKMITLNSNNLYVLPGINGQTIETEATRARYIVENQIETIQYLGINSVYNKRFNRLFLSAGLNAFTYNSRRYKLLEDLLGASFWLDYDQFAPESGIDSQVKQNDIENPDNKIYKGDKFGYDYIFRIFKSEFWSQVEYSFRKSELYAALSHTNKFVQREGFVANGKFPNDSKGKSAESVFFYSGVKTGYLYKINGRHFISTHVNFLQRPAAANTIFVSPRSRNHIVNDLRNEHLFSEEISYEMKYPGFKLKLTFYNTQINNQTRIRSYWHDAFNNNVNLVIKNINQNHQGIELGLQKSFAAAHIIQLAVGAGSFRYTGRPLLDAWQDNNQMPLFKDRVSYLKNYRLGGMPQLVIGGGYRYNSLKRWFASLNINYLDGIYTEPNPDRRTEEAITKYLSNETNQYFEIIKQEKLPSYFLLNANLGKSFRMFKKYYFNLNLSVHNLLNNTNILVNGFESLRWDAANVNRFANKYYFLTGTTYLLIANINF